MARVDVIMPQMGESIAEGTVSRWLKKAGDEVRRDEPILEISTDKVDAEIPAPASGVLAEIKVGEGTTVEVLTVIAVIETEQDAVAPTAPANAATAAAPAAPAAAAPAVPAAAAAAAPVAPAAPAAPIALAGTTEERLQTRSTPLVRRIAAEHHVDIARVPGTGHAGRVTKQDLLSFIESRGTPAPAPAPPAAPRVPAAAAPPAPSAATAGRGGEVSHPTVEAWPGDRVEPMSRIRKLTADHMILSRRTSAHVTSFYEVDYTRIARLRQAKKAEYQARGASLTYLTFITKVIAENLRRHPVLNASVSGDAIIYRKPINIGIAVALDWGLIVPVIRNADDLSLAGIARQMADLAERARTKRLSPDEVQKGTFSITNPGVFGSLAGAPIINQPQVAILGVGAIEKRPKVLTLEDGQDVIVIRTMGLLTLSYDHRVVDGADADRFMVDVKRDLEEFPEGGV